MKAIMKATILSVILALSGIALQAADDPAAAASADCCMDSTATVSTPADRTMTAQAGDSECSDDSCCCCMDANSLTGTKADHSTTRQAKTKSSKAASTRLAKPVLLSPKAMDLASK
jgi:hypothetical protein